MSTPRVVPDDVRITFEIKKGLPHDPSRRLRVLHLNISKVWFDLAKSGARAEDVRRVCPSYKRLANGSEWDLVKLVNGYGKSVPVHWAIWTGTRVVPSYKVTAPNGVIYDGVEPHYVIGFDNF
jgi:hypothetical protein